MRTRAMAAEEEGGGEKRRKVVGDGELRTLLQITTNCSTIGSTEKELQFTDLEEIVEIGAVAKHNFDARARKPRIDRFKARSGENETITTVINSRRTIPAEKTPPATEIEEFFASAETELHKRFIEKYNYDIVNDTPLEGRFQWIQVNP